MDRGTHNAFCLICWVCWMRGSRLGALAICFLSRLLLGIRVDSAHRYRSHRQAIKLPLLSCRFPMVHEIDIYRPYSINTPTPQPKLKGSGAPSVGLGRHSSRGESSLLPRITYVSVFDRISSPCATSQLPSGFPGLWTNADATSPK